MREIYAVTVAPHGLLDVRHSAAKLNMEELREHGIDAGHIYFAGDVLVMRLEGDDDHEEASLVERLRETAGGRSLLDSLETHGWFSQLKMPLTSVTRAGRAPPRQGTGVSALASYGINPGHEEDLERELRDLHDALDRAPSVEVLTGRGLILLVDAQDPSEVKDLLFGDVGSPLQRVLTTHTGYDHGAWNHGLAYDLQSVGSGILSQDNAEPPRPESFDPSGLGRGQVKGTWDPPPPSKSPGHPGR